MKDEVKKLIGGTEKVVGHFVALEKPKNYFDSHIFRREECECFDLCKLVFDNFHYRCFEPDLKVLDFGAENCADNGVFNVVVCGPKNNGVVRGYFEKLAKSGFGFREKDGKWILFAGDREFVCDSSDKRQYAFVGKVQLDDEHEPFLLICGLHGLGSILGVEFVRLTDLFKADEVAIISGNVVFIEGATHFGVFKTSDFNVEALVKAV